MAEIIVDYSETGNRFKKYQNSWNVESASGFPEAPRPAVGDVVTLTGYTVSSYTPTETASVQFHYVEEGGTGYIIEANTMEGATPIYAAGVDDAIASGTVSFTITDVEEGDGVWIVSMVFGTPPIEEKALGGNAVTFFREKIEGMVGDLSDLTTTDKTNLVAAINEAAAGGGGGGATIFYMSGGLIGWGEDVEGPLFYKDSSYQTPATSSEIYAACMAGTTYICSNQSDDLFYTEIVAASNYSTNYNFSLANIEHGLGYDCTISSYISSGTEYYSFHYNEPSSINVVQAVGNSTTDVMSQNATTSMVFADPSVKQQVRIGSSQTVRNRSTSVGYNAQGYGQYSTALGEGARQYGDYGVSIGAESDMPTTQYAGTVALGAYSGRNITAGGMMDISSSNVSYGYNSSKYRLLTGLYDPQSAHDAATKGYVDSIAPSITMTTTDPGEGAPLAANHFIGVYQ
jgi:hypothetical protein